MSFHLQLGKSNPFILVAARAVGACTPLEGQFLEGSVGDSFNFPEAIYEICSVLLSYTFQKHFFLRLYIPYHVLFSLSAVLEESNQRYIYEKTLQGSIKWSDRRQLTRQPALLHAEPWEQTLDSFRDHRWVFRHFLLNHGKEYISVNRGAHFTS